MACSSTRIHHREDLVQASDGLQLFEQSWSPEVVRALVVVVHGYAEHSARYESTAFHLARNGYAVQAFDLRGHGRSQGKRCFVRGLPGRLARCSSQGHTRVAGEARVSAGT